MNTDLSAASVGAEVRGQLAKRSISQAVAAETIGLSQPAFSRRIRGEVAFDVTELAALSTLLGVPVAALLGAVTP